MMQQLRSSPWPPSFQHSASSSVEGGGDPWLSLLDTMHDLEWWLDHRRWEDNPSENRRFCLDMVRFYEFDDEHVSCQAKKWRAVHELHEHNSKRLEDFSQKVCMLCGERGEHPFHVLMMVRVQTKNASMEMEKLLNIIYNPAYQDVSDEQRWVLLSFDGPSICLKEIPPSVSTRTFLCSTAFARIWIACIWTGLGFRHFSQMRHSSITHIACPWNASDTSVRCVIETSLRFRPGISPARVLELVE